MRPTGQRFRYVVPIALVALASCDEPALEPRPDAAVDGAFAESALPNGSDFYLRPVTIERTTGAQTVRIPLDQHPWSDFMEPFDLYAVRSADSVTAVIRLDGARVLSLTGPGANDTIARRIVPASGSYLDVTLTGRAQGSVTLWIVGKLQPAPTITLETPLRSAMLDTGVTGISSIPIRGRACHPRFPITSIKLFAVSLPVSGDSLCASFSTTIGSAFGTTPIVMEATNSRGRTGRLVQSFLRADHWVMIDADATETTSIVNGAGFMLTQSGLDDGNRADLDDMATVLLRAVLPDSIGGFPGVLANTEPTQPACLGTITRRGYRIDRSGPVTYSTPNIGLTAFPGGAQLVLRVNQVTMPVTVTGYIKRSCEPVSTGTTQGTVVVDFGQTAVSIALVLSDGQIGASPFSQSNSAGAVDVSLSLGRRSNLTLAQQTEIVGVLAETTVTLVRSRVGDYGLTGVSVFGNLMDGWRATPGPGFDALGIDVDYHAAFLSATTSRVAIGWWPRVTVPEVGNNAPAPRGPVYIGEVADPPLLRPAVGTVGADLVNAIFWGAWRAGYFQRGELLNHPAAPDIEGLGIRLRAELPPTLQFAPQGNFFRVAWGDLRLELTVDPSVFGDEEPGAAPVTGRAWGAVAIDVALSYDAATGRVAYVITGLHSFRSLQLPKFGSTWIDEDALRTAVDSALWAVAPALIGEVLAALPVPASTALPAPLAGLLHTAPLSADRDGAQLVLPGTLHVD